MSDFSDPHPGWLRQLRVIDIRLENSCENSPKWAAAWSEREHLVSQMCRTAPSTWEGLTAQLSWVCDESMPVLEEATDTQFSAALQNIRSAMQELRAS